MIPNMRMMPISGKSEYHTDGKRCQRVHQKKIAIKVEEMLGE